MNLSTAEAIVDKILQHGAARKSPPLTISVVDTAGGVVALKRQDAQPIRNRRALQTFGVSETFVGIAVLYPAR